MALFAADSIPKAWRRLHPGRDQSDPDDSAFTQARKRLGVAPLRHLFLQVARPMAPHQTKGAFYGGWRLMGIDGTTLDLPDTPANARTFGPRAPAPTRHSPRSGSWRSASWALTPSAAWPSSRSATVRPPCSANCSMASVLACC